MPGKVWSLEEKIISKPKKEKKKTSWRKNLSNTKGSSKNTKRVCPHLKSSKATKAKTNPLTQSETDPTQSRTRKTNTQTKANPSEIIRTLSRLTKQGTFRESMKLRLQSKTCKNFLSKLEDKDKRSKRCKEKRITKLENTNNKEKSATQNLKSNSRAIKSRNTAN